MNISVFVYLVAFITKLLSKNVKVWTIFFPQFETKYDFEITYKKTFKNI